MNRTLKLNESRMRTDRTDGPLIVVDFNTGYYYEMSPLGEIVFDQLAEGACLTDILGVLESIPGRPDDLRERVLTFRDELVRLEVLIPAALAERPKMPGLPVITDWTVQLIRSPEPVDFLSETKERYESQRRVATSLVRYLLALGPHLWQRLRRRFS